MKTRIKLSDPAANLEESGDPRPRLSPRSGQVKADFARMKHDTVEWIEENVSKSNTTMVDTSSSDGDGEIKPHKHTAYVDDRGNGWTDTVEGHDHLVVEGYVSFNEGHSHNIEMPKAKDGRIAGPRLKRRTPAPKLKSPTVGESCDGERKKGHYRGRMLLRDKKKKYKKS